MGSTASSEEKRNNNGVEQKKIRAYGEQQHKTGMCDTSDQNETSIETNSRQRTISKGGHAGHHKKRQASTTERRERRIENRTKESHNLDYNENNSSIKTTKHRRHGVGYFLKINTKRIRNGDIIKSISTNATGYVIVHSKY